MADVIKVPALLLEVGLSQFESLWQHQRKLDIGIPQGAAHMCSMVHSTEVEEQRKSKSWTWPEQKPNEKICSYL